MIQSYIRQMLHHEVCLNNLCTAYFKALNLEHIRQCIHVGCSKISSTSYLLSVHDQEEEPHNAVIVILELLSSI